MLVAPTDHAALRVTVAPLALTYTTSSPSSGSDADVGLKSSTNSSDALAAPASSSLMTRWPEPSSAGATTGSEASHTARTCDTAASASVIARRPETSRDGTRREGRRMGTMDTSLPEAAGGRACRMTPYRSLTVRLSAQAARAPFASRTIAAHVKPIPA